MRRWLVAFALALGIGALAPSGSAEAAVMRIQPLQYESHLKAGEKKKGFVDITNPLKHSSKVRLYVQAFSQLNDRGDLRFYADEQVAEGVKLDYREAELKPLQTLRLFFLIDGTKLPTGDIFAVIFAETVPEATNGPRAVARVGTLLMLTNQTPGPRQSQITGLDMDLFQVGGGVQGVLSVRNPAPEGKATGYKPTIRIRVAPLGGELVRPGPLVFAGRMRTIDFYKQSNLFGLYAVTIQANDASLTRYVFLVTGWWRILAPLLVGLLLAALVAVWRWRKRARRTHRKIAVELPR